ncbi:MAG: SRPBCC domain-containing protein [Cyanobacteria bacterium J06638_6]
MTTVTFEVRYPHGPERVWRALTQPAALASWLMDNTFEPCLGHRFQFREAALPGLELVIDCEVIALDPPRRLVYTWQAQEMPFPSLVTWTLTPIEGGTQLRLCHSGLGHSGLGAAASPLGSALRLHPQGSHLRQPTSMALSVADAENQVCESAFPAALPSLVNMADEHDWDYRLNVVLPEVLAKALVDRDKAKKR